jgi:hypothetical protein
MHPVLHASPHPPQFSSLVSSSTHAPPHTVAQQAAVPSLSPHAGVDCAHATAAPHCPPALHVSTPAPESSSAPEHRLDPGTHGKHDPARHTGVLPEQGSPTLTHVPESRHASGCSPLQPNVPPSQPASRALPSEASTLASAVASGKPVSLRWASSRTRASVRPSRASRDASLRAASSLDTGSRLPASLPVDSPGPPSTAPTQPVANPATTADAAIQRRAPTSEHREPRETTSAP